MAERYAVRRVRPEAPGVSTLFLSYKNGQTPDFLPGQLIDAYFPDLGNRGKPYSISSTPKEGLMITVRSVGPFSRRLCSLVPGDILHASLPYGAFAPSDNKSNLVLLAGGIGITAFRSILCSITSERRASLLYSARRTEELIFYHDFKALAEIYPHITLSCFITREGTKRRITVADIPDREDTEYLICGSFSFISGIRQLLRIRNVSDDCIYTSCTSSFEKVFAVL